MTRTQISAIAVAFSAFITGSAMAANTALMTRADVQAEMADAVRTGNVTVGESGQRMNEVFPNNYSAEQARSSTTRAQVQAELAEAIRSGNVVIGESGRRFNEVAPQNYQAQQNIASTSREEVRAELAEAAANGTLYRHIEA